MTNYNVQLISQQNEIKDPDWQYRGCGIAALKMVMNYWHSLDETNISPPIDEILAMGLKLNAYIENIGWSHSGLVNVAKKYGYDGGNYDLAASELEIAWNSLRRELKNGPVMVSIYGKLGGGHIAVLAGLEENIIHLNDPDEPSQEAGRKTIELDAFLKSWKKRYIIVYPKDLDQTI